MKSFDTQHEATEPASASPVPVAPALVEQVDHDRPVVGGLAYPPLVQRHAGHDGRHAPAIGLEGGQLDAETEHALHAGTGGGASMAPDVRAPLESAFGADFSGVRLHAGGEAAAINRRISATAFTHGQDIWFRDGIPDTSSTDGLHLLAHELTHTVQPGWVQRSVRRTAVVGPADHATEVEAERVADAVVRAIHTGEATEPIEVHPHADDGIHRHAAYEHYLLGELQPREIAMIPAVREVKDNKLQKARLKTSVEGGEKRGLKQPTDNPKLQETVVHLLDREMERLLHYRKNPEALADRADEKGELTQGGGELKDTEYQVPIVVLKCAD